MTKYLFFGLLFINLTSCSAHDEQYYRDNPQQLQQIIKNCPTQQPSGVSCDQLRSVAIDLNQMAYEMRLDPLDYGKKIMALQTKLSILQQEKDNPADIQSIKTTQQELQQRLTVIRWLTSPTS